MLFHLGIGGHGDHLAKLFGGHKRCYDCHWPLTCHYSKRCIVDVFLKETLEMLKMLKKYLQWGLYLLKLQTSTVLNTWSSVINSWKSALYQRFRNLSTPLRMPSVYFCSSFLRFEIKSKLRFNIKIEYYKRFNKQNGRNDWR